MRTYQDIVDAIDDMLSSEQDPGEAELTSLENDYVQAIQAVNTRLKKADDLLRKGHRAEALGLCEAEPNLLDAVQILDFPDRETWAEFVQDFGLPSPPELKIDIASDLNDAYPQEQQLAPLLRRHRFLALSRSDLRSRIDVMRRIAKVDKANPIWNEDLKEFERARHTEIQREFKEAVGRGDSTSVAAIERELVDPRWLIAPPKSVVKQAQAEHGRLRAAHARHDLEKLEPELTAAFGDFDLARGRQLRERWLSKAAIANLEYGDPLLEMVAPALEWLDGEDQREYADAEYANAVDALRAGLDANVDRLELERLYHGVAGLERGLEPELEQRLAERLKYLDVERSRRVRIRVTAIVSTVVVVGALIAYGVFLYLRGSTIDTHAANLEELISSMRLGEARDYAAKLEADLPYVFASADVQGLVAALKTAEESEGGRQALRAEHLAAVTAILDGRQFESIETAANSAAAAFTALDEADGELEAALERSSSESEQSEVANLRKRVTDVRRRLQSRIDEVFDQDAAALRERLEKLEQTDPDNVSQIQQVRRELLTLGDRRYVTPARVAQIEPLVARTRTMEDAASERLSQRSALDGLTRAVELNTSETFLARLEKFAEDFPQSQRGQTFGRLAKQEADLWKGAEAWRELTDKWSRRNFTAVRAGEAAALVQEASAVLDAHGRFPAAGQVREIVSHLQAVAQRGQELARQLEDPLRNPTVHEIYVLRTTNGRSHYSKELPVKLGDRWQIKYILDLTLENVEAEFFEPQNIDNLPGDPRSEDAWVSPQFAFSRDALARIAAMAEPEWEATFLTLIGNLVEDKYLDSVLKLQLLSLVLQTACEGSGVLKQAFNGHLEQLQNARLSGAINWLDPDDKAGQNARIQAKGVLSRMPPMKDVRRQAEEALARLRNPDFGPRYRWLGWLKQESSGTWTCEYPQQSRPPTGSVTELYVLVRPAADADVRYERIGEFRSGALKLDAPSPTVFVEGRPVYALRK